ncbi:hypothetical protein V491_01501 [Pseudogymnoascus sp. VKM F-3775]|nr:hypothetical protein V491_01501 [Pseudogymnoascus sp. VKM F-3775]
MSRFQLPLSPPATGDRSDDRFAKGESQSGGQGNDIARHLRFDQPVSGDEARPRDQESQDEARVTAADDRNTTLPHPSADISPQAFLEASDIIVERSISRKRNHSTSKKGFLNFRNKEKDMGHADDLHAEHKAWEEFKSMTRAANGMD